ncbi:hypothetical protein [Sinorhizobium mexicanum]|uniref:Uncharacterized protein n=1 Tax=Sinorhizobium mexicanum TaxID=375549 RepID=A0A859QE32_9HYPH|nr:hypothetical protein [Sinorhizobium mexicanum]MBP1886504.1 hypothetical protein [Sinorhizobium mexicanum]QLL63923.1 hypothetical protein FKV68_20765 [Sinorhizobium mexicanum]
MLLRPGLRLQTILAAFAAVIAMLMYALSAPSSHSPRLHSASVKVMDAGRHYDHGDHSHDDFELADAAGDVTYHHHADHTHEKAELAFDGNHGWFWRNRTSEPATVTLKTRVHSRTSSA